MQCINDCKPSRLGNPLAGGCHFDIALRIFIGAIFQSRLELNPGYEPGTFDLVDPNFSKIALLAKTTLENYFSFRPS
jgi:hypothetical protein